MPLTGDDWDRLWDPVVMMDSLDGRRYGRKFRLFAAVCCRTEWPNLDRYQRRVVELSEALADGLEEASVLSTAVEELDRITYSDVRQAVACAAAVRCRTSKEAVASYRAVPELLTHVSLRRRGLEYSSQPHRREEEREYRTKLSRLLRDIVGNPFRPVAFAAEWRTPTAVAIARGMYESRDFSAMPILADALQDAGCDSDDVLAHCRDAGGVHVRGCWAVDLVLGKS